MTEKLVHNVESIRLILSDEFTKEEGNSDTLVFIAKEIKSNLEFCQMSPESTMQIIGTHLIDYGLAKNDIECLYLCGNIHDALVIPPVFDQEVETEINSDVDIEDGQCWMCDRTMPLTFHHLIPRTTHKKLLKRGFETKELNVGIMICRPCHNAIHRLIDEETMASDYYTFDLLMEHAGVVKWIEYARKQKIVQHAMKKYKK
jgi:5-methylcytosine-specific restriction endonuclease McrA